MKITKSQLKQIIKEEIETDKALLDAIDKLANNIEDLDISIDFLAGAVTGETPVSLGAMSKGMGRAYMPRKGVSSKEFEAPKKELQEISSLSPEEQQAVMQDMDTGIRREYAQDVVNHVREKIVSQPAQAMAGMSIGELLRLAANIADEEDMSPGGGA